MKPIIGKPILFLLPALIIYILVIVYPAFYTLYLSFFKWDGVGVKTFVGLKNYVFLFEFDDVFRTALTNNIIWMLCFLILPTSIALGFALVLNRKFKGHLIFRSIFYFPYVVSTIIVSMVWEWLYYPGQGLLDKALHAIGLSAGEGGWLGNPHTALYAVILAAVWHGVGAPMVLFLAGLQAVPQEPYEAAKLEGATPWQTFRYLTVPFLRETFVVVMSTTMIGALRVFDIVYAMTGGGPSQSTQVLGTWMYMQTFNFSKLGIGSAIAWVMVIVIGIFTIPYVMFASKENNAS